MKTRERKLHLRFDPGGPDDAEPLGAIGHVLQQSGLTRSRRATEHQDRALACSGAGQKTIEPLAFLSSADHHELVVCRGAAHAVPAMILWAAPGASRRTPSLRA